MDGDKVHATVDFHHVSIVEDRHAFPHMFLRNTVMVLEQRYVGVPVKEDENYSFSAHYGGQRHGIKLGGSATIFAL